MEPSHRKKTKKTKGKQTKALLDPDTTPKRWFQLRINCYLSRFKEKVYLPKGCLESWPKDISTMAKKNRTPQR